jgi:ABC-type transport system substrate-binding protein
MTVYGDFPLMFNAFMNGKVDITDWPVQFADEASFEANPDFWMSDRIDDTRIFGLAINHHNPLLGVSQQEPRGADSFNSLSTRQPTTVGIEFRKAIAHLLDKPDFISGAQLGGRAIYDDVHSTLFNIGGATNGKLPPSVLAEDCSAHPWFTPCDASHPPFSAYNLAPDTIGGAAFPGGHSFADRGYSGLADLMAACDHLVVAGFAISPGGATCDNIARRTTAAGAPNLESTGMIKFYIRTHRVMQAFGQIVADGLNFLFGRQVILYGTSTTETYFTITGVVDIVFKTEPDRDDWNLYTDNQSGVSVDAIHFFYHSQFASSACGGKRNDFAFNYVFYCSPGFDHEADAGVQSATLADANLHLGNALLSGHREVMTVPVYTNAGTRFVALNAWNLQPGTASSLVYHARFGFQNGFWPLLNMHQKPGYQPIDPRYAAGGGDPNLIRRGFSQPINKLSVFHATTLWDFEVLEQVYDSMLEINPLTSGVGQQIIDWMTIRHSTSFNPNEVLGDTVGVTTQTYVLRNDLRWHDGFPLTSEDVVYTLIAGREASFSLFQGVLSNVLDARALDSRTVQLKLTGQSLFYEGQVGSLPIIPKHIWAPLCGDPPSAASTCADPSFDPMATGKMIGSGPWVCKNISTGAVGGSCVQTPTGGVGGQQVDAGGKITLTRYEGYMRASVRESSLHKFSWADKNNDGKVDILDIADAAFRFGLVDTYWNSGQNTLAPAVGTDSSKVDIGELATVAFYFEHRLTGPFSPSELVGLDPQIDPFFCPPNGCFA